MIIMYPLLFASWLFNFLLVLIQSSLFLLHNNWSHLILASTPTAAVPFLAHCGIHPLPEYLTMSLIANHFPFLRVAIAFLRVVIMDSGLFARLLNSYRLFGNGLFSRVGHFELSMVRQKRRLLHTEWLLPDLWHTVWLCDRDQTLLHRLEIQRVFLCLQCRHRQHKLSFGLDGQVLDELMHMFLIHGIAFIELRHWMQQRTRGHCLWCLSHSLTETQIHWSQRTWSHQLLGHEWPVAKQESTCFIGETI